MSGPVGKTTFAHNESILPTKVLYSHKTYALGFTLSKEMLDDLISAKTGVYEVRLGVPYDGNLHVYDLGDGMLVSCDLVRDLFAR